MEKLLGILAGFGGAVALNLLHEGLKKTDRDMPRVDLLGEEALNKILSIFGVKIQDPDKRYGTTLVGDVLSNSVYYSLIAAGGSKGLWLRALFYGLGAGIGAVMLPGPMGLDGTPVSKTTKTAVLTVAYYFTGALVTATILSATKKNS